MSDTYQDIDILLSRPRPLLSMIKSFIGPTFSDSRRGPKTWWTPCRLIAVLIVMAWHKSHLCDRFSTALRLFPSRSTNPQTYQGFIKALGRMGLDVLLSLRTRLQGKLHGRYSEAHQIYGFTPLAVDGSLFVLPKTPDHLEAFGDTGKPNSAPQLLVTSMWHLGASLPWDWRVGSSRQCDERADLLAMYEQTPEQALLIADAGFCSYELFRKIIDSDREVLVRVGANVDLIRKLAYFEKEHEDAVYLWPAYAQKDHQPPLFMRLVQVPTDGGQWLYLLTSVTDPKRLSDEQVADLYRRRWEIEVGYRTLKETMDRRKLRSHASHNVRFEIHGLMLGLMLLGLVGAHAIGRQGRRPDQWSPAGALRVVRHAMCDARRKRVWGRMLKDAYKDGYKRKSKAGMTTPRKKDHKPPGAPNVTPANDDQINLFLIVVVD